MTPEQRMTVAAQIGLDHADEVVDAIAKRSGQQASPALISLIEKAQVKGTPHLPELIADLRDPQRRRERLQQGARAVETALEGEAAPEAPWLPSGAAPAKLPEAPRPAPTPAAPPASQPVQAQPAPQPVPAPPPAPPVPTVAPVQPPEPAAPPAAKPAPEIKPQESAPPPEPPARESDLAVRLGTTSALTARFR